MDRYCGCTAGDTNINLILASWRESLERDKDTLFFAFSGISPAQNNVTAKPGYENGQQNDKPSREVSKTFFLFFFFSLFFL